jgi:hypothetical protein
LINQESPALTGRRSFALQECGIIVRGIQVRGVSPLFAGGHTLIMERVMCDCPRCSPRDADAAFDAAMAAANPCPNPGAVILDLTQPVDETKVSPTFTALEVRALLVSMTAGQMVTLFKSKSKFTDTVQQLCDDPEVSHANAVRVLYEALSTSREFRNLCSHYMLRIRDASHAQKQ